MLVYVWSRRNLYVRMNFFGLMNFQAPYLPWVLLGFSLLLGNSVVVDLMGKKIIFCKQYINWFSNNHLCQSLCHVQSYSVSCQVQKWYFRLKISRNSEKLGELVVENQLFSLKWKFYFEYFLFSHFICRISDACTFTKETLVSLLMIYIFNSLLCFSGIAVGHIYYFLEDVFPQQPGGFRILKTPQFM